MPSQLFVYSYERTFLQRYSYLHHADKTQLVCANQNAWLETQQANLLPVGYFHVVFTLPAEIAFHNKAPVYCCSRRHHRPC